MKPESLPDKRRRISDWLEDQLQEINQIVDHIIFQLRYEDPRIWKKKDEMQFE
jgi:hypothetical protein